MEIKGRSFFLEGSTNHVLAPARAFECVHLRERVCEREKVGGWGVDKKREGVTNTTNMTVSNQMLPCCRCTNCWCSYCCHSYCVLFLGIILPLLCVYFREIKNYKTFFIIFLLMEFMDMTFENFTDLTKKLKTYLSDL